MLKKDMGFVLWLEMVVEHHVVHCEQILSCQDSLPQCHMMLWLCRDTRAQKISPHSKHSQMDTVKPMCVPYHIALMSQHSIASVSKTSLFRVQGQSGIHEDEVMGVGLDATLAQEEAAEQDVLTQLRNRAASLERDLLQRSLDGLAPNSKVQCFPEHPATCTQATFLEEDLHEWSSLPFLNINVQMHPDACHLMPGPMKCAR